MHEVLKKQACPVPTRARLWGIHFCREDEPTEGAVLGTGQTC